MKDKAPQTTAIIPDFDTFNQIRSERVQAEAAEAEAGVTNNEQQVANLALHTGWKEVENHIITRIQALQSGLQGAISNGISFEAIGQRAVVAQMAKEELEGILNFVRTREKYVREKKS